MYLTNALGDMALQFGEHLKNCGGLLEVSPEVQARQTALTGGRMWLGKIKLKKLMASQEEGQGEADAQPPLQPTPPRTPPPPPALVPASSPRAPSVDGSSSNGIDARAQSVISSLHRRRAGARGSTPAGSGALGAALSVQGLDSNSMLTVKRAVMDETKTLMQKTRGQDARTRYSREIDVVKHLTALYLSTSHASREKANLDSMMKAEQVNLQMIANKANSKWVERHIEASAKATAAAAALGKDKEGEDSSTAPAASSKQGWAAPTVLDRHMLQAGGVDTDMYQQAACTAFAEGEVAVAIVYTGEEQVVGGADAKGQEAHEPAIQTDLWAALTRLFPHRVPVGQRVTGLSVLDRRVMQVRRSGCSGWGWGSEATGVRRWD